MVQTGGSAYGTNFTWSIEAASGVTTGISAADRAGTIAVAVAADSRPEDIVQPGHIFPVMAQPGGVLARAGHTEAGCDLAALAGLNPAAVICEVLKEDGTMARLPDLLTFAEQHGLKVGAIVDLIEYRSAHESLISREFDELLETTWGPFRMISYRDQPGGNVHLALVHGDLTAVPEVLVRVHEPVTPLDLIVADPGTHSWPVGRALKKIAESSAGVMVMLNCAQSGEVLSQKMQRFASRHAATPAASDSSVKFDLRTYGVGAQILRDLGVKRMRVLSAPRKMPSMAGFGLEVTGFEEV